MNDKHPKLNTGSAKLLIFPQHAPLEVSEVSKWKIHFIIAEAKNLGFL